MKILPKKIKLNNGFTMQDVIIAMIILILFTGLIGGIIVNIYEIQAKTKLNAAATLYAIQIIENIDKINYDEVKDGDLKNWRKDYGIPDKMNLDLEVETYDENDMIKLVTLTISYEFSEKTETLVLKKFKAREQ